MKRKKLLLCIVIAIIAAVIFIKLLPNEKDRVANDIKALKKAVEEKNKVNVLNYVEINYKDKYNTNYEELTNAIDDFFSQVDSIKVLMSGMKVSIDSTNKNNEIFAGCSLGLKVFANYEGYKGIVFGGLIKPASVHAYFKKSNNHYKIYSAEY
jgi:hypothetical protein